MIDSLVRPLIDPPLKFLATGVAHTPITGVMVTILGFTLGLFACGAIALQYGFLAFCFLMANRFFDGLDGAVARARGEESDFGGYLDITLDYIIYAGIPFFAALGTMDHGAMIAATFVIYSFIGTGISFLAYAIVAQKRALDDRAHQGKKSFYFASGFMEGTETIIFMSLLCLLPQYLELWCYGFGLLCWITTAARIHMAWRVFGE